MKYYMIKKVRGMNFNPSVYKMKVKETNSRLGFYLSHPSVFKVIRTFEV